jgi:hypothetical protein
MNRCRGDVKVEVVDALITGTASEEVEIWYKSMVGNRVRLKLTSIDRNAMMLSMNHLLVGDGDFKIIRGKDIRPKVVEKKVK